ncbi:hypothetical protein EV560_10289 [Bosea sp. BK604]|nr:hypothetical protein EV560_10289 [Bosea sp. BK604]
MYHPSLDAAIVISNWRMRPPTGKQVRRVFAALGHEADVVGGLAAICGRTSGYVNWHLSNEAVIPACLLSAALKFAAQHVASQITPSMRPSD